MACTSAVTGMWNPDQKDVGWRGELVGIPDEPPHLAGKGIEERGDRRGQKFAGEGGLILNDKRVQVQTSSPRLAETSIEGRGKQRV